MNKVVDLLRREPVRVYLYGVLVPLLGALVGYGVIDENSVPTVLALAGVVLGVPAVETARKLVTSPKTRESLTLKGPDDGTAGDSNL